jgi:hypothetical protein
MRAHVKVIAWLHIVFDTLAAFALITYGGLLLSMNDAFNQPTSANGIHGDSMHFFDPVAAFGKMGAIFLVMGLTVGIPGIVAGVSLLLLRP